MWLNKIRDPLLFQGNNKREEYFEGWYYKQISKDHKSIISFIPGFSLFNNDVHSFVQYIFVRVDEDNKKTIKTAYVKYPVKDFKCNTSPFMLQVGKNIFTESMISIKLSDENINIEGTLKLGSFTPIKKSILMPNIMGFFAYIPKMECYHGIVSMNHSVNGVLRISGEEIVKEEVSGEVKIYLYNKQDGTIYEDISSMAGIEIVGF